MEIGHPSTLLAIWTKIGSMRYVFISFLYIYIKYTNFRSDIQTPLCIYPVVVLLKKVSALYFRQQAARHSRSHSPPICTVHPLSKSRFDHVKMPDHNLTEIDSLEATIIIDNELDPLSTIAPDTVHVSGQMATLAKCSPHKVDDRGPACRELKMEDICCSAHGLSILVVSIIFYLSIYLSICLFVLFSFIEGMVVLLWWV